MPAFRRGKLEPFAQAFAETLTPKEASMKACYARTAGSFRRAERPDMIARVAEIRREAARAAEDLLPVINRLMVAADKAEALDSAAGYAAMRGLLVEAARLKILIADRAPRVFEPKALPRPLTTEEWLMKFGPRTVSAS